MILAQSNQFQVCKEAFDYQIRAIDRDNVRIVAEDGIVRTSLENFLLFSPLLTDIVASSSMEYVTLIVPSVEKVLLSRLMDILTNGFTTLSLNEDILEMEEMIANIIELAEMFGINIHGMSFDSINLDHMVPVDPLESSDLDLSDDSEEYSPTNNNKRTKKIREDDLYQYEYKCIPCHKSYMTKAKLTCHQNIVHKVGKFSCSWCQGTFSSLNNLHRHQRTVNSCRKNKRIICQTCGNILSSPTNLERHIRTVHMGVK